MSRGMISKIMGAFLFFWIGLSAVPADGVVDPTTELLMQQGIDLRRAGDMTGALASFEMATEIDPMSAEASLSAAQVALGMGDDAAAAQHVESALARQAGYAGALQLQAILRERSATVGQEAVGTGGSGFAEFGLAALIGSLFIFAMSMYDIGQTPPVARASEEEEPVMGTLIPFCRTRAARQETREVPHEWIEAA